MQYDLSGFWLTVSTCISICLVILNGLWVEFATLLGKHPVKLWVEKDNIDPLLCVSVSGLVVR